MNSVDFLQAMNDIDADLIEGAAGKKVHKKNNVIKWLAAAACLLLISGAGFMAGSRNHKQPEVQTYSVIEFSLNDTVYCIPASQQFVAYNLVDNAVSIRSTVQGKQPIKEDLGEEMGSITVNTGNHNIVCKVYHYIAYPLSDEICIVEFPDGNYQFFVRRNSKP